MLKENGILVLAEAANPPQWVRLRAMLLALPCELGGVF